MSQAVMFGEMIASIAKSKASAGRAKAPKRGPHPPSRAVAETLERRCLLSALPYSLSQLAYFGANEPGIGPDSIVVADPEGDLIGTTNLGGANGAGMVFEIPAGSNAAITLATFNVANGEGPTRVTLDSAGNVYGTTIQGGTSGDGTVFEVIKGSSTITTLASFNGANGSDPRGRLTLDAAGNLYGTTYMGGANGWGTVFEVAKGSDAVTTLASFNGMNGANPLGGVTLDAAGNLYGTTDQDSVFEIAKGSNIVTTLAGFDRPTDGTAPFGGITLDSVGNLYGTTNLGGANGLGTVFEVAKGSTTITTLVSFNGTDGAYPIGDVTLDSAGNIYGTTEHDGAGGYGTVFKIAKGSTTVSVLASFYYGNGANPSWDLTLDSAGNLYGTTTAGGPDFGGTVFKLSPAVPGDANLDGKIDFADLVILARNYGVTNATWSDGDFNDDGTVGFDDLVILARNYGKMTTAAATNMAAVTRAAALAPAIAPGPDDQSPRSARAGRHRR